MNDDLERTKALDRYQVISAYLALDPPRGARQKLLNKLAAKNWTSESGKTFVVAAETIRVWVRRYRQGGLSALRDKRRSEHHVSVLSDEEQEALVRMKEDVRERSLNQLIKIVSSMNILNGTVPSRSTLHRVLKEAGISGRPPPATSDTDLDRFEADFPGEIWQSDMLKGPWLPDPDRLGRKRQTALYAFMDDHSRLILYGRFSFRENLPALELVFRRCLQRWGQCRSVYYDNGSTYRSNHMKHIVAELGIHPIIFTTVRRPMGHGKIEALNRRIKNDFIAEVKSSNIETTDALNEAFLAWADLDYNKSIHSETGQTPLDRWHAGSDKVCLCDEQKLRNAFMWRETRTPDKAGCFSLLGRRYQVDSKFGRKRIEVRFDPEALEEVEVWRDNKMVQRSLPFEVKRHRRPRAKPKQRKGITANETPKPPAADYLRYLVDTRSHEGFVSPEPSAQSLIEGARADRATANQAIIDLLIEHIDTEALDTAAALAFLDRHGPFDLDRAQAVMKRILAIHPKDQHVTFYLEAIRRGLVMEEE